MFDSVPPNLPVAPATPPQPPAIPLRPSGAPLGPMPAPIRPLGQPPAEFPPKAPGKKEPEDIFSGIETGPGPAKVPSVLPEAPRHGSSLQLIFIIGGTLVLIGAIGFALWTFVFAPSPEGTATPAVVPTPKPAPIVETPPVVETPSPSETTNPTTTLPEGVSIPVPTLPPATSMPSEGIDTDTDGLTDIEEPYYGSDPANPDTDGDTFPDGSEVRNLFDPSKKGVKLADSSFISQLLWSNWSFLAPKPWSVVGDSTTPNAAYVATGSATRFLLERRTNPSRDPIDAWLAKNGFAAPTVVKTKNGIEGRQSSDGLTTYLSAGDSVLIFTYDLHGDASFDYRTSYAMMIASMTAK